MTGADTYAGWLLRQQQAKKAAKLSREKEKVWRAHLKRDYKHRLDYIKSARQLFMQKANSCIAPLFACVFYKVHQVDNPVGYAKHKKRLQEAVASLQAISDVTEPLT